MIPKTAHVLKDLDLGGIQTLMLDLLKYYARHDIPHVFVCIGGGELESAFQNCGANVYFLKKRIPYFDPFTALALRRILLREGVEAVQAHHTSEGITALAAVAGTRIKVVQSFHVAPAISNVQDNAALKFMARRAHAGVAPSESQRKELQKAGYSVSSVRAVYNGVHPDRLVPQSNRNLRSELNLPADCRLMVSIGNFYNDTRDQLTICKALPAVFERFPDARHVFFGGFTNRYIKHPERYLKCKAACEEAGIADKVIFAGKDSDIGSILQQCDLFVYSSLGDTFGMAVAEAMLSNVPVIANDLPVITEVTGGEQNIFSFRTKDPQSASRQILSALSNPTEALIRAEKARTFAESRYTIKQYAEGLAGVVGEIT